MHCGKPLTKRHLVDTAFRPAALEARLRLRDTILHSFHGVAACERPPRTRPVCLEDHVRVHQYGAAMPDHDAS